MKRSLAWSWPIGAVLYAVSTWLSADDGVLVLGAAQAAEPASLSGDELRKAVSGKTVYLRISGFELPIHYSSGGTMSGRMSGVAATLARGDATSDRGKWWVSGSQLCQQWTSWMGGSLIATRSPAGAIASAGCAMTGALAARGSTKFRSAMPAG